MVSAIILVAFWVVFVVHAEVKFRQQQVDSQELKGSDDDLS